MIRIIDELSFFVSEDKRFVHPVQEIGIAAQLFCFYTLVYSSNHLHFSRDSWHYTISIIENFVKLQER
jgi:hypothetical protein